LEHGDAATGMRLSHGGHPTHGSEVSFLGKWHKFIPCITSGIRLGTPAVTTRGFAVGENEANCLSRCEVLSHPDDRHVNKRVSDEAGRLCQRFSTPGVV